MKHNKTTIITGALALTLINAINLKAEVIQERAYLGFDGGVALQQEVTIKAPAGSVNATFDPGFRIGIRGGYQLWEELSLELESGLIYNSMDKISGVSLSSVGASAELYQVPIMANAIYSFTLQEPFSFYAGGGLGAVVSDFRASAFGSSGNSWDTTFGYQLMAGFKYAFDTGWELNLGYKFLGTTGHDLGSGLKTDGTGTHSILAGFTYKF